MAERKYPAPQEIYRHFKDKSRVYQIITIAEHTETGEAMVVYQALYGDFKIYVRPLDMFMSGVDRQKYPDAETDYRFERMDTDTPVAAEAQFEGAEEPSSDLMRFLDAGTYEERRNLLLHMRPRMTDRLIDDIAASLDVTVESGDIDARFASLLRCVQTLQKYEVTR